MEKASAFLASHGIQGSGEAKFALSVRKQERGAIDLQLEVDPHRLEIVNDGTRLVNLNGGLWVRKVLDWIPGEADARPPTRERPAQPKPFSPKRRSLTADRVDFGPVRISDLSSEVEFERRRLRVEKLAMNLLGGTAGGSVRFEGGKRFSVETNLQFARLNLNELLGPSRRLKGDSVVEGLVNLTAAFDGERGSIDLERTEGEVHISRIGRHALNRLLLFFDPEGLNPSIVGARSAIMLANPKEVRATLSKGSLGLKIKFQAGLLSRFSVKSIPISDLPFVQDVTQVIPEWDRIKRAMLLLGAQRYSIGADGGLIVE